MQCRKSDDLRSYFAGQSGVFPVALNHEPGPLMVERRNALTFICTEYVYLNPNILLCSG